MSTAILVIGKHDLLRSSLCNWLAARFPTAYIIDAANETEGIALAQYHSPRIIILDAGFPGMSSLTDILNIKTAVPATPLVVLTTYDYPVYRAEAITVGVSACLPKEAICTELQPVLTGLLSGQPQNGCQARKELAKATA
jgi:DNA-binding NarL/FixJ family response regulator